LFSCVTIYSFGGHVKFAGLRCLSSKYTRSLYFLGHLNFLCPSFNSLITFMSFPTVSDKVLNVYMHSWLPILSCQQHHSSRPGPISAITLTAAKHLGNTSSFLQHRPLIYQALTVHHLIAIFEHHTQR
jgi:hypothetical protein